MQISLPETKYIEELDHLGRKIGTGDVLEVIEDYEDLIIGSLDFAFFCAFTVSNKRKFIVYNYKTERFYIFPNRIFIKRYDYKRMPKVLLQKTAKHK